MKKILSFILAFSLLISLVPVLPMNASAETFIEWADETFWTDEGEELSVGYYAYEVIDGEAIIIEFIEHEEMRNYSWFGYSLSIPATLGGYPVVAIKERAIWVIDNLGYISIPASVTSIEKRAFYSMCLSTISVDEDNPSYSCSYFSGALYNKDKTELICFPTGGYAEAGEHILDGVTTIGDYAFFNASFVSDIVIPDSVTTIGNNAFDECYFLESVTLGKNVKTIGNSAFQSCGNLTDVYYGGTEDEWNKISIDSSNEYLAGATIHYSEIEDEPTESPTAVPTEAPTPVPTAVPTEAPTEYPSASGKCGDNLFWSLDGDTITFNGTGDMNEYESMYSTPWNWYYGVIKTIVIEEGVTSISPWAFNTLYCKNISTVYYAGTEEEWSSVSIDASNDALLNADIIFLEVTPTEVATAVPTEAPTTVPTAVPTLVPTAEPAEIPTEAPTEVPTEAPVIVVPAPSVSVESGVVPYGTVVEIDAAYDSHFYYQINGGEVHSEFYFGTSITIYEDTVLKVGSWKDVLEPNVQYEFGSATYTYTIDPDTIPTEPPATEAPMDAPKVSIGDVRAKAGSTVEVDVILENSTGFADLGLEIGYDSSVMTLVEVTDVMEKGSFTTAQDITANPYNIGWSKATNISYNGVVATLTFEVSEDAPKGEYPITVSYYKGREGNYVDGDSVNYDENFVPLGLTYEDGTIEIYVHTPGDVNGDGGVTNKDATYILRYLSAWELDTIDEDALDVNGDGVINNKDATILLRYLAGWSVEIY